MLTQDRVVGVVLRRADGGVDPFFVEMIAGMEDVLHPRGVQVLVQTVPDAESEIRAYESWARSGAVSGVVLSDLIVGDVRADLLTTLGLPHVTLGEPESDTGGAVVRTDNERIMADAVARLTALGHTTIGRVSGPQNLIHSPARGRAFVAAMRANGGVGISGTGDYSAASGDEATRRMLAEDPRPTAIIFDNDVMAVAGLETALALGVRVPEELSILAWDDALPCRSATPELSAMAHDVREVGALAGRELLGVLDGHAPNDVVAPRGSFIARGTTTVAPM